MHEREQAKEEPKPVPGDPLPEPPLPVALRNLERLYDAKRLRPRVEIKNQDK
jgi:hypothetical protein